MKFQKVEHITNSNIELIVDTGKGWKIIENSTGNILDYLGLSDVEMNSKKLLPYDEANYKSILPVKPVAYRDFILYEQHMLNAAKGFVKKYMPKIFPVVKVYETLFGKPFPMTKPHPRWYKYPIYYLGNHLNFFSEGYEIKIPEYTKELDYELELGVILSKPLLNAKPEEVNDAIGGFVILNDFSARDQQMEEIKAGFGIMKTKNFGSTISATVVSASELLSKIDDLKVKVFVNNDLIVEGSTGNKKFSLQEAIAFASWEEQLHPGELFGSGTIPGCCGMENGRLLNVGDSICLEVEGIGKLTNYVI